MILFLGRLIIRFEVKNIKVMYRSDPRADKLWEHLGIKSNVKMSVTLVFEGNCMQSVLVIQTFGHIITIAKFWFLSNSTLITLKSFNKTIMQKI